MSRSEKNNIIGSDFWVNSESLTIKDILIESRVPDRWRRFDLIEDKYQSCIIKPINRYVSNLYPRAELVSIDNNTVTLMQKTHAEIWVKPNSNSVYALDKTWQRQFYPSPNRYSDDDCLSPTYKFYIPWFVDLDVDVVVSSVSGSIFSLRDQTVHFSKSCASEFIDSGFVDFKIKKLTEDNSIESRYAIIDIGTPMYTMRFDLSDSDIRRIKDEYR